MSTSIKVQRICQHCGNEFTARTTTTQYCSHRCNSAAYKEKKRDEKIEASNRVTQRIKSKSIDEIKAKEFLTVRDAATLLNCSHRTVYRMIAQGNINAVNIAQRKTLIRRSDLDGLFSKPTERVQPEGAETGLNEWVREGAFDISESYTLAEVQNKYGISEKALFDVIRRNNIPKIKKGWFAYVPKMAIDNLLR